MSTSTRLLGDVATIFNGKTPSKIDQRDTGFPVLKIKDVTETGEFRGIFTSFVDIELAKKYSSRWVKNGDTLILNAAHNADYVASKLYLATEQVDGVLPTGEWLLVRPHKERILPRYLHYWFHSQGARKAVRGIVKGIHLYPKDVDKLTLPYVSLTEQQWIVDILSRAEGIVRLHREALDKTRKIIPALFIDMFGDPSTNPKSSPVRRLSEVADVISGATKGRKITPEDAIELPYMRVANVQDGYLDLSEIKTITVKKGEIGKYRLEQGDLLMTEGGDLDKLGRAALWAGKIDPCLHQNHVFKVRCNKESVLPEYLRTLVGSHYGKAYFLKVAKRTTGIASINKTQLSGFPVLLPPLEAQTKFASRVAGAESIQSQATAALVAAQATFQSLLHRAFTGGI